DALRVAGRMVSFGYFLASEEYGPDELVRQANLAEQAGFERLWISDHYHPWNSEQGNSPFVWSVIGALSQATDLPVTTAVTCPIIDRKSTRLNSSHVKISYAVFCLKKKRQETHNIVVNTITRG